MAEVLVCWKCGGAIADLPLPLGRLVECPACRADLHVCRMCVFYDTRLAKGCREPIADEVSDKERANFCGYFQARAGAYMAQGDGASRARRELEALFGGGAQPAGSAASEQAAPRAGADAAREQLERLFGSPLKTKE